MNRNSIFKSGRGLVLLLALVLGLGFAISSAPIVQAADISVCASGCNHTTIQSAFAAANSGDTINVAEGEYSLSSLDINKSVTIKGNNAGIPAANGSGTVPGGRLLETVLTVTGELLINADDITLDGLHLKSGERVIRNSGVAANRFTVKNSLVENTAGNGNEMFQFFGTAIREDWSIKNNRFIGNYNNGTILFGAGNSNVLIEANDFMGTGNRALFGTPANTTIRGNYFASTNTAAINMNGLSNPLIENNTVHSGGFGLQLTTTGGGLIRNNLIVGASAYDFSGVKYMRGIDIFGTVFDGPNASGLVIENNEFQNFTAATIDPADQYRGIHIRQGAANITIRGNEFINSHTALGIVPATPAVSGISLTANDLSGVVVGVVNGSAEVVTATCNWWGQESGPEAAQTNGNVEVSTWLINNNLVSPNCAGGQPVQVFAPDGTTLKSGHSTIQAGINAATNADVIKVAAGTYAENVNVNKSVTLNGAQAYISVSGRTANGPDEATIQGGVSIQADNVSVIGFSVTNPSGGYGLSATDQNNLVIMDNLVTEIGTMPASGTAQAISVQPGSAVNVSNIQILDNGISQVGNMTNGSNKGVYIGHSPNTGTITGLRIDGNQISSVSANSTFPWTSGVSKGAYGIQLNHGAAGDGQVQGAQIVNNTISNLSGFWVHAIGLEGPTPNAVVLGNDISQLVATKIAADWSAGWPDSIAILFEDNPGGTSTTVAFNTFGTNVPVGVALHPDDQSGGVHGLDYTVDARNNWWGSASGPSGEGSGTGAVVSTNVTFDPWLANAPVVSNTGNGDTVNGPVANFSVTYNGPDNPLIILSQFAVNPDPGTASTLFGAGTQFFDINVEAGTTGSIDVILPAAGASGKLQWFDDTDWLEVSDSAGDPVFPSGGVYAFTLSASSSPTLAQLTGTPFAGGAPEVWMELPLGHTGQFAQGETVEVIVKAGSSALYGVDLSFSYPAGLEVTKVVLGGTSLANANLYADTVTVNSAGGGVIRFAFSQRAPAHPDNVDDEEIDLATITFLALPAALGAQNVEFDDITNPLLFTDKDGNNGVAVTPVIVGTHPLVLDVTPSPSVYVDVALQGRSDHAGLQLEVKPVGPGNVLYDASAAARLEILAVPASEYMARVSAPKYLAAIQSFELPANVSDYDLNDPAGAASSLTLTLRGGDINGDDRINIQDLVLIGVSFGMATPTADINGDGVVNIQDLAIAAGNFGLQTSGPTYPDPWE